MLIFLKEFEINDYRFALRRKMLKPLISIHVNSKHKRRKWPLKMISACFLMLICLASNTVPENWHKCVNKRFIIIYLG